MGRPLTGTQQKTPVVSLRAVGNFFKGVLKAGPRIVRMKRGSGYVYDFGILDTNAPVQKKNEAGTFVEAEVSEGDTVAIFAPTVLKSALDGAKIGETIYIEYLGKQLNKAGTEFHNFKAEVV